MVQYSGFSGLYSNTSYVNTQDYWQISGLVEADHYNWYDLSGDPLATALTNLNPIFFDALYDARMIEFQYNMTWFSDIPQQLSRHAGAGPVFSTPDESTNTGIKYSDFLNNEYFNSKTIVFVMQTTNGGLSHVYNAATTQRSIFKAKNALVNMQIESYPFSTNTQGAPAYLRVNINGSVYSNPGDRVDINDGEPHIVIIKESLDFNNNSVVELYVDGTLQAYAPYNQTILPTISDFGFGQWSGDPSPWGSPYPYRTLSVSHLAIYNYLLPQPVASGLTANLSIPDGGGWYVVADGRWRRVLV
jgi:hypothetical protein